MSDSTGGAIFRRFGWCSPTDAHHSRCRKTYETQAGVTVVCSCPNHKENE